FAQKLAGTQLYGAGLEDLRPVSSVILPGQEPTEEADWLASPVLKVISGPTIGSFLKLRRTETTFGRSEENHYSFSEAADLSRFHCRITTEGKRIMIADNQSTNGTFVNGNLIDSMELRVGDLIEIGAIQMELVGQSSL